MVNKAVFMTGIREMEIREIEMPVPIADQVLINLNSCGVCGSDIHYYENGRIADFVVKGDFILGHECAGIVVQVGEKVKNLKVGDKVCLEPGVTCGQCEFCKSGRYNLCPDVVFLATPPYHGAFRQYIAYPESMCFKLPDNMTTVQGALVEPLAVGLHAASQGQIGLGSSVAILGAGCIGLMTLQAAKAFGATHVTVTDISQKRLNLAAELGADVVINAKEMDPIQAVMEMTHGRGVDVVIETAGSEITIQQTAYLAKRGGKIVLVGMSPHDMIPFNFSKVLAGEIEIKTVFRYRNLYPVAISAIASGRVNVDRMVTHEFSLLQTKEAFEYVIGNREEVIKAVIKLPLD